MPATDMAGRRRAAAASESHVAEAAREVLARGNAVDAVVAGVLVAAAESPGRPSRAGADARRGARGQGSSRSTDASGSRASARRGHAGSWRASQSPRRPGSASRFFRRRWRRRSPRSAPARCCARPAPRSLWLGPGRPSAPRSSEAVARRGALALAEERRRGRAQWPSRERAARPAHAGRPRARFGLPSSGARSDRSGRRPLLRCRWRHDESPDAGSAHVIAAADARGTGRDGLLRGARRGVPVPALGLVAPRSARSRPSRPAARRAGRAPLGGRADRAPRPQGRRRGRAGHRGRGRRGASARCTGGLFDDAPHFAEALASAHSGRAVAIACTRDSARALAGA